MSTYTPTKARANFYNLLRDVNESHVPIEIVSDKNSSNAIIIGKSDWDSIQETLYLNSTGTSNEILRREREEESELLGEIDWDILSK